jgi:phosphoglycerate dehydrogenase-like enzyme
VARAGVGYDSVDTEAASRHGVAVTIAPGTNQGSVAEHTFCLMLALVKNLIPQHLGVRAGQWPRGTNVPLRGQTLGLVGLGRIGKAMATRAQAFEMRVIAHDPAPDTAWAAAHAVPLVSFDHLLRESDFVSLHVPLTPQTRHLIGAEQLALMKPGAVLINTTRGPVVDEQALIAALRAGRLFAAGLDVYEHEPHVPPELPAMENVVLLPHIGSATRATRDRMAGLAAEGLADVLEGKTPRCAAPVGL